MSTTANEATANEATANEANAIQELNSMLVDTLPFNTRGKATWKSHYETKTVSERCARGRDLIRDYEDHIAAIEENIAEQPPDEQVSWSQEATRFQKRITRLEELIEICGKTVLSTVPREPTSVSADVDGRLVAK